MDLLPSELLVQIFRYLDGTAVLKLRGVCKRFKNCLFAHHERLQRKSLGADRSRADDVFGCYDFSHPVHLRLVFCRSNRTVNVERKYREWRGFRGFTRKFQMTWDEFAGLYRHVSVRNVPTIVVFSRILDDGVVELLHLLEYKWHEEVKLVLKVNDMQVDRSAFRRLMNHMQVFSVDLCGSFDRSFISNTLFSGTRVQSFTLGVKKGEAVNIGIDFLEPFFENWIYYQTLSDYARLHYVMENFVEESVSLELPHLCLDGDMIKFENLITIYFLSLGRLTTDRFRRVLPTLRIHGVSSVRITSLISWSKNTTSPHYTVSHYAHRAETGGEIDTAVLTFMNASKKRELELVLHTEVDNRSQKYPSMERIKRLADGEYPAVSLKEPAEENEEGSDKGLLHPEHVPYEIPMFTSSREVLRVAAPRTFLERKILEWKLNNLLNGDEERRAYLSFREEQERKYREENGIELKEETPPYSDSRSSTCSTCSTDCDSDSDESEYERGWGQGSLPPPRKRARRNRGACIVM